MSNYLLKVNSKLQFGSDNAKDVSIWLNNHIKSSDMLEDLTLEIDFDDGKFTTIDILFTAFKLSEKLKNEWTAEAILDKIEKSKGFTIGA